MKMQPKGLSLNFLDDCDIQDISLLGKENSDRGTAIVNRVVDTPFRERMVLLEESIKETKRLILRQDVAQYSGRKDWINMNSSNSMVSYVFIFVTVFFDVSCFLYSSNSVLTCVCIFVILLLDFVAVGC